MDAQRVPAARARSAAQRAGGAPRSARLAVARDGGARTGGEVEALGRSWSASPTTTPTASRATSGRCSSRPTRSPGRPTRTAMLLNPNNHALDGGPATAAMEKRGGGGARRDVRLAEPLGHLTSSGTIANLEALWVARESSPGRGDPLRRERALHARAHVRGARRRAPSGCPGRLRAYGRSTRSSGASRAGGVGTVVATLGTTSLGALDPIEGDRRAVRRHGVRLHVDAAYGGFFTLLADGGEPGVERGPFDALALADSIVVDPHKHGLQPYGCGCVLFARSGGRALLRPRFALHLLRLDRASPRRDQPGMQPRGSFRRRAVGHPRGASPHPCRARRRARGRPCGDPRPGARSRGYRACRVVAPALDIICVFPRLARASQITARCEAAFDSLAAAGWHTAKLRVGAPWLAQQHPWIECDEDEVTALRMVLMKPAHAEVVDELAGVLREHSSPPREAVLSSPPLPLPARAGAPRPTAARAHRTRAPRARTGGRRRRGSP